MENKKKSNTGLIVAIVIICVFLFFALIGFGGYYVYKNVISPNMTTTTTNNGGTTTTIDNKKGTDVPSSKDAKAADKDSPLAIGSWGLASKYAGKYLSEEYADKSYIDVPVRVTKVSRGDKVIEDVKKLLADHHYRYDEPKSSQLEWVIVDYQVDLSDVKFDGSLGTTVKVNSSVKGTDGSSVKYDGITYILSTVDVSSSDYYKEPGVYDGKFVTQLPKGCKDYLIKLGDSYNGSESYFKGE